MAKRGILKKIFKACGGFVSTHAPEICIGAGIAGGVATTVLAVKETPKAMKKIEEEKEKQGLEPEEKLPVKDVIRVAGPCYIKPAITGVGSVASVMTGAHIYRKRDLKKFERIVALETALAGANAASGALRSEIADKLGEDAAKEIFDHAQEKYVEVVDQQNAVINEKRSTRKQVVSTGDGDILYFEPKTYMFFRSSEEALFTAAAKTNAKLHGSLDGTATLADFYMNVGLPPAKAWEDYGWNLSAFPNGHDGTGPIMPMLSGRMIRAPWGEAAIVVEFEQDPILEYDYTGY